jgi:predicted DNA-binding transcriptional regulator YafY
MSQFERIFGIHRLLKLGRAPSIQALIEKFEVSRASIRRDLQYMSDRLGAPIRFDRLARGYRYVETPGEPPYELPGLWLSADEIHALLLMDELLGQLQTGLLREPLRPLRKRLKALLEEIPGDIASRIRLMSAGSRTVPPAAFRLVTGALSKRARLEFSYLSRYRNESMRRIVSPQKLIYYRSNWYLDAWCHARNDLRSFAIDAIRDVRVQDEKAIEVDPATLDGHIGAGYGIFAGPAKHTARLRFRPEAAVYVRGEQWHPGQTMQDEEGGFLRLDVPYAHPQEILMDVMRHGQNVEVLAPASLRSAAAEAHRKAAQQYEAVRRAPSVARTPAS